MSGWSVVCGRQRVVVAWVAVLALAGGGWVLEAASATGSPRAPALAATLAPLRGNTTAHKDYLLNCAGCHGLDGAGVPRQGVPDFRHSAGVFTRTAGGREYLIRVPGSSGSVLTDEELAGVLNWIVAGFGADGVGADFRPFTTGEVGRARPHAYADPVIARERVVRELRARGLRVASYAFGKHPGFGAQANDGR